MKSQLFTFSMIIISTIMISSCIKDNSQDQVISTRITSPSNGQEFSRGEVITISTTVDELSANIVEVRYYIDGIGKSSVSSFPYNYEWNTSSAELGSHTIKATSIASDNGANSDEITIVLTEGAISGEVPVAAFYANVLSGDVPLSVQFTDQSSNFPTSWQWSFGDGETSELQNPSHIYNLDGYFNVELIVANDEGKDTLVMTNYIVVGNGGGGNGSPCPGTPTVTDIEGNVYSTVQVGNQCWMKENLKTGTFVSGAENMTNNSVTEKFCYDDIPANCDIYGGLYQWDEMMNYTTQEGSRGICPQGWHIPSDQDWKILEMHLGMTQAEADAPDWRGTDQGDVIKTNSGWIEGGNGSNTTGFSGLPAGYRGAEAMEFGAITEGAYWWSSTQQSDVQTWYRAVGRYTGMINRTYNYKGSGISIRCVKD